MDLEKEIKQIATETAQEEISKIPPVVFPTSIRGLSATSDCVATMNTREDQ